MTGNSPINVSSAFEIDFGINYYIRLRLNGFGGQIKCRIGVAED